MHELSCIAPLPLCRQHVTSWISQGYSWGGSHSIPGEGDLRLLWFLWWVEGPRSRGCMRCWACEDCLDMSCLECLAFGRVGSVLTLIICCWHFLLWGSIGDLLLFCPGGRIVVIHSFAGPLVCTILGILFIYGAYGCVPGSVGWLQHPTSLIGIKSCRYKTACVLRLLHCYEKTSIQVVSIT